MNILWGLAIPALAVAGVWVGYRLVASQQRKGRWS